MAGLGSAALLAALVTPLAATADTLGTPGATSPCGAGGAFTAAAPSCVYTAPGEDTFTVPDGVTAVDIDLFGAEGGSAAGYVDPNPPNTGARGGLGGESRATLPVTPGQILHITLGAAGIPGSSRHGEFARPGGYGHGSGGGGAHGGGGSGGGGSEVRADGSGPAGRILVAGGGGGAGNGGPLLRGGDGGGLAAEAGGQGGGPAGSGIGGTGGTQTGPGTGVRTSPLGAPGGNASDTDQNTGLPNPGSGGTGGNGARGGNGGGGGGGGYFGGGGGSGGGNPGNLYAAGGGGGSSFAAPSATGAVLLSGVRHGDGKAVVSFRYGTATTLIADTGTPLFGHPVTLTATVTPANPAGGPTGSVTFSDGAKRLATVPLDGGRASFTTSGLQPGSHALTASYGGDAADEASTTADPAGVTVGFSAPCVTTARSGPLTVAAGQAVCLSSGARQNGPVTVRPGGALAVLDAEVTGPVSGDGALALTVCRSTLAGPLSVRGSTGPVLLGSDEDGPADAGTCAGNRFTGAVSVDANTGGVVIAGNRVTGPLRCEGNEPPPRQTQNTVMGPRSGQCR